MEEPDRISILEQRIAELERKLVSPQKASWQRTLLRNVIVVPVVGLPLILALESALPLIDVPLATLGFALWCGAVVLWLTYELFTGNNVRFSLNRLLVVMFLFSVIFAGWNQFIWAPQRIEKMTLASINGLTGTVHREPKGPQWIRSLLGDEQFERAVQISINEPGGDEEIPKLNNLPYVHYVFLNGSGFTDKGLGYLERSPYLIDVVLTGTAVSKAAVDSLRKERPKLTIHYQ